MGHHPAPHASATPSPRRAWLWTRDKRQQLRLQMALMSTVLMFSCIVAMQLVARAGLAHPGWVHLWSLASGLGMASVVVVIRCGWNLRFRDPSLTLLQISLALVFNAAAYVIAGPVRGLALAVLAVIFGFGVFRLTRRQTQAVLAGGLLLYAVAIGLARALEAPHYEPLELTLAYGLTAVVAMISSTLICLRLLDVQERKQAMWYAVERERERATRDELTGLHNRRFMLEVMQIEGARARRSGQPLLMAQFDLDHFKTVNDTHGHAAGDLALQSFARTVQENMRASDVLARWGGEEFVLLMGQTDSGYASLLLDRIRAAVARTPVQLPSGQTIALSVSIGVARLRADETPLGLLHRADQALYEAKSQGRNQVVWAPEGDAAAARRP